MMGLSSFYKLDSYRPMHSSVSTKTLTLFSEGSRQFCSSMRCLLPRGTASLMSKDSSCTPPRDASQDAPSKSSENSGKSISSYCKNACGSEKLSYTTNSRWDVDGASKDCHETTSTISGTERPISDCRRSETIETTSQCRQNVSSTFDDPCTRVCRNSSTPLVCPDAPKPSESCCEPPPSIWTTSEEVNRKAKIWRRATLFGALPIVALATLIIGMEAAKEAKKPRPEVSRMEYMYRRTKPFPWGDGNHTLFHNPVKNPVPPNGYEVDDPNAVKPSD